MKKKITQKTLKRYLSYNSKTGIFARVSGRGSIGFIDAFGYRKISICGTQYLAHRLAWLYVHGKWPISQMDHKDGNPSNNAISNLREATHSQNRVNASAYSLSKTGVRGVHYHRGAKRYRVQLMRHGKSYHGGYFALLEDAERAAVALARKLHGDFACAERTRIPLRKRKAHGQSGSVFA